MSLRRLAQLQDEGASRAEDALRIGEIEAKAGEIYAVFADAVINRNLEETQEDLQKIKENAAKDIAAVHNLVDTNEERAWADEFEEAFNEYIEGFENKQVPILFDGEDVLQRAKDALAIKEVEGRVGEMYAVFADAVINRNLDETREDLAKIKKEAEKDIATVYELVDTDAERARAEEF